MTTNSASNKLKRDELMKNITSLIDIAQNINDFKFSQKIDDKITDDEFRKLSVEERKIRDLIDELTLKLFESIVTDIKTPGDKIQQTIGKVNDALGELEEVNKILGIASKVINLFTTVTLAASTGNVAQISTIIEQIDDLLKV